MMNRQLQMQHGKDPEEENASGAQSVIVIDIPVEEDALLVTDEIQDELIVEDEETTISTSVVDEEIVATQTDVQPDIHTQNDHIIAIQDEEASSQHNIYGLFFCCFCSYSSCVSCETAAAPAADAHRPIINMILYDSFQYTSIVVMLR